MGTQAVGDPYFNQFFIGQTVVSISQHTLLSEKDLLTSMFAVGQNLKLAMSSGLNASGSAPSSTFSDPEMEHSTSISGFPSSTVANFL